MSAPMVVVLGAGASRGSGEYGRRLRPPLTRDLFNEGVYGELLQDYDLAHQAGRYIGRQLRGDSVIDLETILHGLRTSDHAHHRQMAIAVPPYLQHLLHAVSEAHYQHAFRIDHLIEKLLCLPYVYFITLNYDLLLDRRLASYSRLTFMDDYISEERNWSLIKLHGSVNWYRNASERFRPASPPSTLSWEGEISGTSPTASLEAIREMSGATTWNYPALALPEGPEDQLVLPPAHLEFARSGLSQAHQFDLLVIGYSGLDKQVIGLLNERRSDIRRMTVVNSDFHAASEVHHRLLAGGVRAVWPEVVPKSFGEWMDDGDFDRLIDEFGGPYPGLASG